ncbi:hypothetical protein C8E87_3495 [Paractinoplanes brasiliensis]|uniref:Uncharacterized protein n=1 Tax=Paractinoplanes brasiliensis TaxID=52695 RepID=A0A4R6JT41_9ACTN|nr:hypothetical protein C8E87_3495 [Actinoplanes brasiliensis]
MRDLVLRQWSLRFQPPPGTEVRVPFAEMFVQHLGPAGRGRGGASVPGVPETQNETKTET